MLQSKFGFTLSLGANIVNQVGQPEKLLDIEELIIGRTCAKV